MISKRRYLGFGFLPDEATGEDIPLLPVAVFAVSHEDAVFKVKARYERISGESLLRLKMKVYPAECQEAGLLS